MKVPRGAATAVTAALVLAPAAFSGGLVAALTVAAVCASFGAGLASSGDRGQRALFVVAGAMAAALFAVDVAVWVRTAWVLSVALAFAAVSAGAETRRSLAIAAALGVLAPAALSVVIWGLGGDGGTVLRAEVLRAHETTRGLAWTAGLVLVAGWLGVHVTLGRDAALASGGSSRALGWVLTSIAGAVLGARLVWIGSYATLPTDMVVWSESPFLTNLLKLGASEPVFGPASDANSYIYSPTLEVVQYALLSVAGAELSLGAHRLLGAIWQLSAGAVVCWALWRSVRPAVAMGIAVAVAVFSSLLAPHVHADHALLLCFCAAIALVLGEQRLGRRGFVAGLVLLPVCATAFKLTGAGVGVGLVLVHVAERRWREIAWLALSAVLALATIPLFDATFGPFSDYAIRLLSEHPKHWEALLSLPRIPEGRLVLLALAVAAWGRARWAPSDRRAAVQRVALLTVGMAATALLGFVKHGGRTNSLVPLVVGSTVVLLLVARWWSGEDRRRAVAPTAALAAWIGLTLAPLRPAALGKERSVLVESHRAVVEHLKQELAAGRRPLSYSGTAAWIDAGRREVPLDRVQSVTELYLGGSPAVAAHYQRLESGRYDSLVMAETVLRVNDSPEGRLAREIVGHTGSYERAADAPPGIVILERRPGAGSAAHGR